MLYTLAWNEGEPSIHHYVPGGGVSKEDATPFAEAVEEIMSRFEDSGEPERALIWKGLSPHRYFL